MENQNNNSLKLRFTWKVEPFMSDPNRFLICLLSHGISTWYLSQGGGGHGEVRAEHNCCNPTCVLH